MGKRVSGGQTAPVTKDSLQSTTSKAEALTSETMDEFTKGSGATTRCTDTASFGEATAGSIWDNT